MDVQRGRFVWIDALDQVVLGELLMECKGSTQAARQEKTIVFHKAKQAAVILMP